MPVSRIATCTLGRRSSTSRRGRRRRPGPGRAGCGRRACSAPSGAGRAGRAGCGRVAVVWEPLGAKPNRSYCSSKTFAQVGGPSSSSGSQWSKPGSFGVLTRTLSLGLVPGKAASAPLGTMSAITAAPSTTLLLEVPIIEKGNRRDAGARRSLAPGPVERLGAERHKPLLSGVAQEGKAASCARSSAAASSGCRGSCPRFRA